MMAESEPKNFETNDSVQASRSSDQFESGQANWSRLAPAAVLCWSGGLDSTSLLMHLLAREVDVTALSFHYGQRHALELQRLQMNLRLFQESGLPVKWHLIDLSSLQPLLHSALTDPTREMPLGHYADESMRETVVPNRNAIFAAIAYAVALSWAERRKSAVSLSLAVHSGDHTIYPDCRPEFYGPLIAAFAAGNWNADRVWPYLPYLPADKAAILRDAVDSAGRLQVDFETVFANTCTSYLPDASGRSHGLTGADVERILAFHELGRIDPLDYQRPWQDLVQAALALQSAGRPDCGD